MLKKIIKSRAVQAPLRLGSSMLSMNFKPVCSETPGKTMKVTANTEVRAVRNYQAKMKLLFTMIKKATKTE